MNEHQKYIMREKIKYDKQQMVFTGKGLEIEENDFCFAKKMIKYKESFVFCPFCLNREMIDKFLVSTKKGLSRRLGKCPECQNGLLLETLIRMLEFTPKEYAEFVYNYPRAEFWKKCKFELWKKRLTSLNMQYDFWDRYKQLKEENYQILDSDDN